jgi:hypothetical protein
MTLKAKPSGNIQPAFSKFSVESMELPSRAELNAYSVEATETEPAIDELELVLQEPPATNVFVFPFDMTDLNFYPQPPLTQELDPREYDTVTETEAYIDGKLVVERPENIVNSLAVYGGDGKKAFHIYRPQAIDANGDAVFGTIEAKDDALTVTISADWLEKAAYPVIIDPTFGYTTAGASKTAEGWQVIVGLLATMTENGSITKLTIYGKSDSGTENITGYLVASNSGAPALPSLATTSQISIDNTPAWHDLSFSAAYSANAADYWLCVHNGGGTAGYLWAYYDTGDANKGLEGSNSPSFLASYTLLTKKFSIYATYTASAPPAETMATKKLLNRVGI